MDSNDDEFIFDKPVEIPTVHVETETFSADVYELYEMPSGLVLDILGADGPLQMQMFSTAFRLALVNPQDEEKLDILSFNELASAMFQWYKKSSVRISSRGGGRKSLQDLLNEAAEADGVIEEVHNILNELRQRTNATEEKKRDPKLYKPLNDPGDGIEPF